jgi:hypothetical protein
MIKSLLIVIGMTATTVFAGWNGTGVPGGTGDNKVNDSANWTDGVIDGNFCTITAEGTNALALTANISFTEGASKTMGVFFASNSTAVVFTSVVGVAVGQTVNGTSIPYNTHLIALSDTNGTLSRVTTGLSSGSYTLARPALDFDFGTYAAARGTNVIVTLGSDEPGAPRTLSFSGRLCLSQYTLPATGSSSRPTSRSRPRTARRSRARPGSPTPGPSRRPPSSTGRSSSATTAQQPPASRSTAATSPSTASSRALTPASTSTARVTPAR